MNRESLLSVVLTLWEVVFSCTKSNLTKLFHKPVCRVFHDPSIPALRFLMRDHVVWGVVVEVLHTGKSVDGYKLNEVL